MPAPAVFPALAVIAGVAAGVLLPALRGPALPALLCACLCAALAWRTGHDRAFALLVLLGFGGAGVLLGAAQVSAASCPPLRDFFDRNRTDSRAALPPLTVEGVVRQDASPTESGVSMILDVIGVQTTCGWLPAAGGVRVAVAGTIARERMSGWRAGRRVRLPVILRLPSAYRDPGVADEAFGLMRRGITLTGSTKSGALVDVVRRGHALAELAGAVRAYARRAVAAALPDRPVAAAIVTAILVGDRGALGPDLERRLQEAGTYHVIAISGGNVAILAGLVLVLLHLARVPRRAGAPVVAGAICAYGYIAGGGASVARATLAAAMYFLATAADHRSPALNVLATVALAAVVYDPLAAFDPGLMLSYGATLALLIAGARLSAPLRRLGPPASSASRLVSVGLRLGLSALSASRFMLVGTVAAEVALLPVLAFVFHRITVAAFVLNFVAIPLMTVTQSAGVAVVLLWPISSALARGAGIAAGVSAEGLTWSARLLDVAPWLTWRVPAPPVAVVVFYYASWLALLLLSGRRAARPVAAAACACATLAIACPSSIDGVLVHRSPPPGQLRVTFLDVGQGDSILVQFPGGLSLLVDAAGLAGSPFDVGDRVITPALLALGVRRLDYLAITHGDPDHVEGGPSVARDFRARELWEGAPVPPHETLRTLRAIVERNRGAVRLLRPDDRLEVGPVELRVLHPTEPDWERQRVRNDDSIVMELRYGDVSIVLPGDIGAAIEDSLASRLSDAPVRILKAAHHGSATSSGDAWLTAARAAAVVFSCGRDNRYGHPAPEVLQRVLAHRAAVFRTDEDGAITVTTDGHSAWLSTFTGRISLFIRTTITTIHQGHEGHEAHERRHDDYLERQSTPP